MIKFLKKYFFILGIILFLIILSRINIGKLFQNIEKINPLYLILAFLTTIPMIFSKALCWNYIKRQQGIKYGLKDSLLMYYSCIYLGFITPGKLGELAKAVYLKKDGHPLGGSLVSVVLDRVSDIVFLLAFVFVGSLFYLSMFQKQVLILISGLIISVILLLVFIKTGLVKWALIKAFNVFIPEKYKKSWQINSQDFINSLKIYKLKHYSIIFAITTFSWLFYYLQMGLLAHGLGIKIPFVYLAVSVTAAGLITLIPISLFGIGTRDATLILLFSPFLIPKEQIIVFSALILFLTAAVSLMGLICWLIKPIKI